MGHGNDGHRVGKALAFLLVGLLAVVTAACAPAVPPLFGVTVQATDEKGAPVAGALVQTSDGQSLTTGPDGKATVRWGRPGRYTVTVIVEHRVPATLTVAIPEDAGRPLVATLAPLQVPVAPPPTPPAEAGGPALAGPGMPYLVPGPMPVVPGQPVAPAWAYPFIFQAMFSTYGYGFDLAPYRPGQWTSWEARSGSGPTVPMRKAFLGYAEGGREWWQVRVGDDAVMEVLFSEGRQSVRRVRHRVGNEPPREVPVAEGWYTPPLRLTAESLEGAVVERGVEVRVPAGTFRADRLEFAVGGGLVLRVWRAMEVPGGMVRYELAGPSGEGLTVELTGHGDGAATELGSF